MQAFRVRLARPLSALALLIVLAPARPADCLGMEAGSHGRMPCCEKGGDDSAAFDAGCCRVREGAPQPDRAPATTQAARRAGLDDGAAIVHAASPVPETTRHDRSTTARAPDPPSDPLYLLVSCLRR
jgi:hypothetical protein